jgi:predicted O-methyltransferase YrrM
VADTETGKIAGFLRMMTPERPELLKRIEEECRAEYIPLVTPETGRFLQVMVQACKPARILEVGTGIGYSAILLAAAGRERLQKITTIEIDPIRFERARRNFHEAEIMGLVEPLLGDAAEIIPTLTAGYNFVFMDAAKGQYPDFFSKIFPLLNSGGILIIDNIFLGGWVVEMTWPERRKKTMVCRVRELLETLKDHPELATSLIPLGDGLAVSVRR